MYKPNAARKSNTRILYLMLPFLNLTVSDINKHKKHCTYTVTQILGVFFSSNWPLTMKSICVFFCTYVY